MPKLLKQGAQQLISPFIGGGSIELAWLNANPDGFAECYDIYEPLVEFWRFLLIDPQGLATLSKMHMPCDRNMFSQLQKNLGSFKGIEKAAAFFVLNRCSFGGATNSGGMSPGHPRFTESSISRVRDFRAPWLRVRRYDALSLMRELEHEPPDGKVIYLDPPYMIKGAALYGDKGNAQRGFDHVGFAEMFWRLNEKGWRMLLSYNDDVKVRALYNSAKIENAEWSYGMRQGKSSEVLIYSEAMLS